MIAANPLTTQTLEARGADLKGGNKLLCSYVSREDFAWLKQRAIAERTTMSAIVRGMIERGRNPARAAEEALTSDHQTEPKR